MHSKQSGSTLRNSLITIVSIVVLLAIAFKMLPRSYSDDLSKIGNGTNIVVLIQNKETQQSMNLITLLDRIRADYDGKIEFLIADIATPEGQEFVRQQQLDSSVLAMFAPNGKLLDVVGDGLDEKALRTVLDDIYQILP